MLSTILYNEVLLFRRLKDLKQDLTWRHLYSHEIAFRSIERYLYDGRIGIMGIRDFFMKMGQSIDNLDALRIIRRIDTDFDAKISYREFIDFLNYQIGSYQTTTIS